MEKERGGMQSLDDRLSLINQVKPNRETKKERMT
jgi:hypothetical protein